MHPRLLATVALALGLSISPEFAVSRPNDGGAHAAGRRGDRPARDEPRSPGSPLAQAFVAVFGSSAPVTRVVTQASNPPCCRTVTLKVTPGDLVELGPGRYALVSLETNPLGSHAEQGAISIAYLDGEAGVWHVEHVWNELAWSGDSGTPADFLQDLALPRAPPLVFAVRRGVWQGRQIATAWAFTLAADEPRAVGRFNAGGELDPDNGCSFSICGAWAYIAGIDRPSAPGALFSVAYGGWREAPGVHRPTPFAAVTNYVERAGALVAMPPVKLPGSPGD